MVFASVRVAKSSMRRDDAVKNSVCIYWKYKCLYVTGENIVYSCRRMTVKSPCRCHVTRRALKLSGENGEPDRGCCCCLPIWFGRRLPLRGARPDVFCGSSRGDRRRTGRSARGTEDSRLTRPFCGERGGSAREVVKVRWPDRANKQGNNAIPRAGSPDQPDSLNDRQKLNINRENIPALIEA